MIPFVFSAWFLAHYVTALTIDRPCLPWKADFDQMDYVGNLMLNVSIREGNCTVYGNGRFLNRYVEP